MGDVVDVSRVTVHKDQGKNKRAYIEGFPDPVLYGLHGGVKNFYRIESDVDLPTTLDHLVAAVASCMTGTLAGALEARGIPSYPDKILAEVEGCIENVENKPLLTRSHVKYHVKAPQVTSAEAQRAIDHHEGNCAVAQSVRRGFTIEWEGVIEEE